MCEDDFSKVHGDEILENLSIYESESVCPIRALPYESEEDMRFVYCACAIKKILEMKGFKGKSSLNEERIAEYIQSCQSYDTGFSWTPFGESHAGLSYCALASLVLLQKELKFDKQTYIDTIIRKQCGGFSGRTGKYPDTCYSFWNIAQLQILETPLTNI